MSCFSYECRLPRHPLHLPKNRMAFSVWRRFDLFFAAVTGIKRRMPS
ncbi:hypothetical protein Agau_C102191 [Agrobacterium tumefaciens F2]|nr:hypothetical protein Agau_C102191 [Agrobacterium tumefaciens F2]